MHKISWLVGLVMLLAASAWAQDQDDPKVELFGGYSYVRFNVAGTGANLNGGSAALAVNPNRWLGFIADFGAYNGSGVTTATYLFGPRFSYRSKSPVTPFAQVLVGGAHATNAGNTFAMTAGGGFDLEVDSHWSWRMAQAEYLLTTFNDGAGSRQHNARISTGIVYRW